MVSYQKSEKSLFIVVYLAIFIISFPAIFASDSFEPDASAANASWILTNGTWQNHEFSYAGDLDYVKFNCTAGSKYVFETVNLSAIDSTDTVLHLYDTDGTSQLRTNDDVIQGINRTSFFNWRCPSTDTYFLKASEFSSNSGSGYKLRVVKLGYLIPYLVGMSAMNVTKNEFFIFEGGVQCVGGYCYDVELTLDPKPPVRNNKINTNKNKSIRRAKVDKEVLDAINSGKDVKVIVKLKDLPPIKREKVKAKILELKKSKKIENRILKSTGDFEKKAFLENRKEQIAKNQDDVLKKLKVVIKNRNMLNTASDTDIVLEHKYTTINAFAGKVSKKGFEKIINDPNVDSVFYDRILHTMLSSSGPAIGVNSVWSQQYSQTNITGKSETICVIDSGIDYTHDYIDGCSAAEFLAGNCSRVLGGWDYYNSDANPIDGQAHGTHVAGIIGSNHSSNRGLAPEANFVALKACNDAQPTASCGSAAMIASVDWCNANASRLNISVITMSIGDGGQYGPDSSSCPSWMDSSLKTARELGIFVSIATGNNHYTAGISYPACSPYALPIGGVTDADALTYNRGELLRMVAPAQTITSTVLSDAFSSMSGTSMATPFVAGAAALLQQYHKLRFNKTLTPKELEHLLIYQGVSINDISSSDLNYSRVDIDSSISAKGDISTIVGATPFYTTDINPQIGSCLSWMESGGTCNLSWSVNSTGEYGDYEFFVISETPFYYNSSERINITIYNSPPGTITNLNKNTSTNTSIYWDWENPSDFDFNSSILYLNGTNLANTSNNYYNASNLNCSTYYNFTVLTKDNGSNINYTPTTNLSTTLACGDSISPVISLIYPTTNQISSITQNSFNCSVSDDSAVINVSLYGNWSSVWHLNSTNSTGGDGTYIFTQNISDGNHIWNCYACDNASNCDFAESNNSFSVDSTYPLISLNDQTTSSGVYSQSNIYSNVVANDSNLQTVTLFLYNTSSLYNSLENTSQFSYNLTSLVDGIYYLNASCNDSAGNVNYTQTNTITLDTTAPVISQNISNNSNPTNTSTISLNITALDSTTNISNITIGASGTYLEMSSVGTNVFQLNSTMNQLGCSVGFCTIYFNATDYVNNSNSSFSFDLSFSEETNPIVTLESLNDSIVQNSSSIELNISVNDSSSISSVFANNVSLSLLSENIYQVNTTPDLLGCGGEGICIITFNATDEWGNSNNSVNTQITIDNTLPVVFISVPLNNSILNDNSAIFGFNYTDAVAAYSNCSLVINSSYISSSVVQNNSAALLSTSVSAGSKEWYVACTDNASNIGYSGIGLFNSPGENSAEIVMTTASTEYVLNATNNSNISLMTLTNENGSINISEYVNNPANTTTSSGSGFAELAIPRFIVINATQNIESNLSWAYLRIYYNSTDLPATLDESTIVIYYFNETTSRWQAEVDSGVDASNNYAWANVSHFSVYSVGGSAEEDEDTPVTSSGSSGGGGGGGGGGGSSDVSVVPSSQGSTIKITLGDKVILKHGGVDYKFSVSTAKSGMVTLRSLMYSDTVTVIGVDKPNYDVDKDGKNDITLQISYTTGNYVYITVYKYEDNSFTFTPIMPSFPTKKKTLTKTVEKKADVTAPKTSIPINNKTQLNKSINQSALAKFQTNFRNSKAFYWIITGAWIGVVMLLLTFIVAQVYTRYLEDPDSFWFKKKKKNKDDEEEMKIM